MKKYQLGVAGLLALALIVWMRSSEIFAQEIVTTEICIRVYNDLDGNGVMEEGEGLISGAFVQIFDSTGHKVAWYTTDFNYDPICTPVKAGQHRITVKNPEGYKWTTKNEWELELPEGATAYLEFGVQRTNNSTTELGPVKTKSPASGLINFVSGLVLGAFTFLLVGCPCTFGGVLVGGTVVGVISQLRRPSNLPPA